MTKLGRLANSRGQRLALAVVVLAAVVFASVGEAQRRGSSNYEGLWAGTLTMDAMVGVPADDAEGLSRTIDTEITIQRRGNAQLFFDAATNQTHWQYQTRPSLQLTELGNNAVIAGRGGQTVYAQSASDSWVLNLTRVDDATLLAQWSRVVVETPLGRNSDRLEWMLGGLVQLRRIDPSESAQF